jgi:hypothetical protein
LDPKLIHRKERKPRGEPGNAGSVVVGKLDGGLRPPAEAFDQLDQNGARVGFVALSVENLRRCTPENCLCLFDSGAAAREGVIQEAQQLRTVHRWRQSIFGRSTRDRLLRCCAWHLTGEQYLAKHSRTAMGLVAGGGEER